MNAIARIRRNWAHALAAACMLGLAACASVESTPAPAIAAPDSVAVLPLANFTETPDAGRAAQAIAANTLRKHGFANVAAMPAADNGVAFDTTTQPGIEQGLEWARAHHAKFVLSGAVEEWRYKVGVDGEPVVALSFELREVPSGRVVWSATGSRSGWSRSALGGTAQSLVGKLLAPLGAHG
ncbi:MAG: penicillin-binding protein activator LpoB [Paraburkholderia sp.]|uniref:penicillin-binding protein activator LpoB n=1 Tax=Paraburkholderia sp. TaxID=1926495 RepID=UPI001215BB80|nr:penicillin-binding protein activator LpoB [Paraburkholderia sp.]TAM02594.1 MAG: penicillin-binding protein activator LpoB [Paraburkholderia sp.]TAM28682.1 MAG: penicillin-binding protein activator LpoB [Paraburkholderia sp.]